MFKERIKIIKKLEKEFDSILILYVTSDRPGAETQIASDAIDSFINQLDKIGPVKRISLVLDTCGGETLAAWNLVNLIKMYCDEFEVIIPYKALSAGTLISLGANRIVMTKQAILGPIDPSLDSPLNPKMDNQHNYPVSVEAVEEYIKIAKDRLGLKDDKALADVLLKLSEKVHPLVLGQVFRTREQIKMIADKLLASQIEDKSIRDDVIKFLCSESGSHDYTINRREAKIALNLNIQKPTENQYNLIKELYDDFSEELELKKRSDFKGMNSFYLKRGIIETKYDSYMFVTEGTVKSQINPNGSINLVPNINSEGWRKM